MASSPRRNKNPEMPPGSKANQHIRASAPAPEAPLEGPLNIDLQEELLD